MRPITAERFGALYWSLARETSHSRAIWSTVLVARDVYGAKFVEVNAQQPNFKKFTFFKLLSSLSNFSSL